MLRVAIQTERLNSMLHPWRRCSARQDLSPVITRSLMQVAGGCCRSDDMLALAVADSLPWHEDLKGAGKLLHCAVLPCAVRHACFPITPYQAPGAP